MKFRQRSRLVRSMRKIDRQPTTRSYYPSTRDTVLWLKFLQTFSSRFQLLFQFKKRSFQLAFIKRKKNIYLNRNYSYWLLYITFVVLLKFLFPYFRPLARRENSCGWIDKRASRKRLRKILEIILVRRSTNSNSIQAVDVSQRRGNTTTRVERKIFLRWSWARVNK